MAIENPLWMQNETYPARLDRGLVAAIFGEGLLTGFAVSQRGAGANMSVDVAAGKAVVAGDDQANQGNYYVASTATENVVVTAAPGANSRYDIVVLQINDPDATGPAGDNMEIQVIAGTAAASPVVPSTPDSALLLATIGPITTSTTSITTSMITNVASTATLAFDVVDDDQATRLGTALSTGAGQIVRRASDGHIGINPASFTNDVQVVNKGYVDNTAGDTSASPNSLVRRGATGRISIDGPVSDDQGANKGYVDAKTWDTASIVDRAVTDAKAGAPTSATLTNGSTSVLYYRFGDMVFVSGTVVAGSNVTLPAGFRPASTVTRMGSFSKASDINTDTPSISINSAGTISRSGGPAGGSTFEAHFLAA